MIFYEAPHRINAMLESCASHFEISRQVFLGRELTKKFEQHFCGTLAMAQAWLTEYENHMKGEFVVVIAGGDEAAFARSEARKSRGAGC